MESALFAINSDEFDPLRIGRAHMALRPYGFVSGFWEKLGETIIDVVLGQEAVRSADMTARWTASRAV